MRHNLFLLALVGCTSSNLPYIFEDCDARAVAIDEADWPEVDTSRLDADWWVHPPEDLSFANSEPLTVRGTSLWVQNRPRWTTTTFDSGVGCEYRVESSLVTARVYGEVRWGSFHATEIDITVDTETDEASWSALRWGQPVSEHPEFEEAILEQQQERVGAGVDVEVTGLKVKFGGPFLPAGPDSSPGFIALFADISTSDDRGETQTYGGELIPVVPSSEP